jgi:hypothetical protein
MNDYQRVTSATSSQSWPAENWMPLNALEERRVQSGGTIYTEKVQNWRPPDLTAEHHHRSGMNFDVPSTEYNRTAWVSEDRKVLENTERLQQHIKEAVAEWRLRDGQDPDCAEFERLRTPTYTVVESG